MFRNALLHTTFLRNAPDLPVGGAAPAPVLEPGAAAPAPVPESPAAPVADPLPLPPNGDSPAAGEPPAPVPETPVAPDPAKPEETTESLLSGAGKEEPKPVVEEPKSADETPEAKAAREAAAAAAVVQPVVEPVYEFTLPEGITADPVAIDGYTALLKEHKISPEIGQAFLNRHTAELTKYGQHLAQEQHRIWGETIKGWKDQSLADPEIGGNGQQTAMKGIAAVRDMLFQGDELKAFNKFLDDSGAGNHPLVLKAFHRMSKWMTEPPAAPNFQPTPTANNGKPNGKGRGLQTIYAQNAAARGNA